MELILHSENEIFIPKQGTTAILLIDNIEYPVEVKRHAVQDFSFEFIEEEWDTEDTISNMQKTTPDLSTELNK